MEYIDQIEFVSLVRVINKKLIDIVVGSRFVQNLRKVQLANNLFADNSLVDGNNFTIEMETGTGKHICLSPYYS